MTIKRRQLLQIAGFACAPAFGAKLLADDTSLAALKLIAVRDSQALPLFAAGDLLLADTQETQFSGDGVYFYPHWGEPRPYRVSLVTTATTQQILEFRNPGNPQLLWTQSFGLDDQFAGKLIKSHFPPLIAGRYSYLKLPHQPPGIAREPHNSGLV